jgi:hypothetical protein
MFTRCEPTLYWVAITQATSCALVKPILTYLLRPAISLLCGARDVNETLAPQVKDKDSS